MRVYSSIFYILSNFHTLTSESMYYIQYLTSCILSSMTSILYAIFDIVSCIYYIQYCMCTLYVYDMSQILNSTFYVSYIF